MALATVLLAACGSDESSDVDQFSEKTESALVTYGEEGDGSEREQAIETVSRFLAARSAGDWKVACEQLSGSLVEKFERLATTTTTLANNSCAPFLDAFVQLSAEELSEKDAEGGSLRQAGRRGFLIYFGAHEVVCAMPLEEEDGEWKVAAVSAKRLS